MHKCLRIIFSLACILVLVLGSTEARAYTISPTWYYNSLYLQAYLGLVPGTATDSTPWHGRMENVIGTNSAISDWTISYFPITESWGSGGKTTAIGGEIDANLSAHLTTVSATLGHSAVIFRGFTISADTWPPLTHPVVTIAVSWGGNQSQAAAQVALQGVIDGCLEDIIPISDVNLNSPGNQQTFQETLPSLGDDCFFTLNLWDGATWARAGNFESDMWISMTVSVTEAMQPPSGHAPLPGAWTLLGGGLAIMAGLRRRKKK